MRSPVKIISLIAVGVFFGLVIWFGLLSPTAGAPHPKSQRPLLSKLPPIKNCVEHVRVVKAELVMWDDAQMVSIELENQAYVGILSISVEQVVDKHKNSVGLTGFEPEKPPKIVMAPGEKKVITLGNLGSHQIRIGAAIFSDGSEEGCPSALRDLREAREHETKIGASRK